MAMASGSYDRKPARAHTKFKTNGTSHTEVKAAKTSVPRAKLLITPRPDWHATELPPIKAPPPRKQSAIPPALIETLHKHAQTLLEDEANIYTAGQQKASSSYKFMSTIMGTGTWSDKVSALTLVVQESPLHTAKTLENLIGLAAKKSRNQALMALGALKDLMDQSNVLPDRKLRFFNKQSVLLVALQGVDASLAPKGGLPNGLTDQHLIMWAYEDKLKRLYLEMLKILEHWCHDELEFSRLRAIDFVWELLKDKPEQEENLLRFLVNKLGDTAKKVASKASYRLCGLQESHPAMTMDVISAIESDILLRPGQSSHAKYYAVITLNQFVLRPGNPEVANRLLDVYFTLFKAILNRSELSQETVQEKKTVKGAQDRKRTKTVVKHSIGKSEAELDEKVTAQVLTGIHRAFPYSEKDSAAFEKHFDTMFRITHSSNFNTSLQALVLIQQISTTLQISTDRYMRTLYQSLFDPRLFTSSKQPMYMNLLYRSLKDDASIRRVKAFVKRLIQTLAFHEPPFICLALYLIIELSNVFPGLKTMLDQPEVHDPAEDQSTTDAATATDIPRPSLTSTDTTTIRSQTYDGRKREPEFSNADTTCLWDLLPYTTHAHPSVSLFATHILTKITSSSTASTNSNTKITKPIIPAPPKPDPATHTLTHFLDKFAYRNPKAPQGDAAATKGLRGSSIMQPALASTNATDALLSTARRSDSERLNNEAFWQRKAEDVRADEVFFHRYFGMARAGRVGKSRKEKQVQRARAGRGGDGDADDVESVDDGGADVDGAELDEDEVWRAIVGSRPDVDPEADADMDEFGDEDVSIEGEMESEDDDDDDDDDQSAAGSDVDMDGDSDEGGIVPGEEDADMGDAQLRMDENGGVPLGDSIEDLLNSGLDLTSGPTAAAANSKAKPPMRSKSKSKTEEHARAISEQEAEAEAEAEPSDDEPFALGSDEGSSASGSGSDDESDTSLAHAQNGKGTAKGKGKGQRNQRRVLRDDEVKAFIAEETKSLSELSRAAAQKSELKSKSKQDARVEKTEKIEKGRKSKKSKRSTSEQTSASGDVDGDVDVNGDAAQASGGDAGPKPKKRRKLKQLPMFGSAEDWASLIEREDGGRDDGM